MKLSTFLNLKSRNKKIDKEIGLKFSKGDRVTIVTRSYDGLKYKSGSIVSGEETTELNVLK